MGSFLLGGSRGQRECLRQELLGRGAASPWGKADFGGCSTDSAFPPVPFSQSQAGASPSWQKIDLSLPIWETFGGVGVGWCGAGGEGRGEPHAATLGDIPEGLGTAPAALPLPTARLWGSGGTVGVSSASRASRFCPGHRWPVCSALNLLHAAFRSAGAAPGAFPRGHVLNGPRLEHILPLWPHSPRSSCSRCGEQGWNSHLCLPWSGLAPAPRIAPCPLQCQLIKLKS